MRGNHEQNNNHPGIYPVHIWFLVFSRTKNNQPSSRCSSDRRNLSSIHRSSNSQLRKAETMNQIQAAKYAIDQRVTVKTVILKLLELSPMTDPELCDAYRNMSYIGQAPATTDQNIRTHRAQLHKLGLVHVVGTTQTASGREARIWRKAE